MTWYMFIFKGLFFSVIGCLVANAILDLHQAIDERRFGVTRSITTRFKHLFAANLTRLVYDLIWVVTVFPSTLWGLVQTIWRSHAPKGPGTGKT